MVGRAGVGGSALEWSATAAPGSDGRAIIEQGPAGRQCPGAGRFQKRDQRSMSGGLPPVLPPWPGLWPAGTVTNARCGPGRSGGNDDLQERPVPAAGGRARTRTTSAGGAAVQPGETCTGYRLATGPGGVPPPRFAGFAARCAAVLGHSTSPGRLLTHPARGAPHRVAEIPTACRVRRARIRTRSAGIRRRPRCTRRSRSSTPAGTGRPPPRRPLPARRSGPSACAR